MPAGSNISVLGHIAAAIHPDDKNYAGGYDYYNSPVHTALEQPLSDDSWPHIRREYLFNETDKLTKFPHNKRLTNAKNRDLPATFFYEVIRLVQCNDIDKEAFPAQCVDYYNSEHSGSAVNSMRNHARRWFFHCYAFILGQKIIKNNIIVNQLKSIFSNTHLDNGNGIGKTQYDSYIETAYLKYCRSSTELFDGNVALRFKDKGSEGFNKNPILSGPRFMTNIFGLSFGYDSANAKPTRLKMETGIELLNGDTLNQVGNTEELDFEKGGCKSAAVLFIFCDAAERVLSGQACCSPVSVHTPLCSRLTQVEEIVCKTLFPEGTIMPNIQQRIGELVEKLIELISNEEAGPTTRYASGGLFNDIQAFINKRSLEEPDSIHEVGSLHIVIPNTSCSLPESAVELKFHFFNTNRQELSFHYIESYSCNDGSGKSADGYYFIPGTDHVLFENDYLSCDVKVGTILDPANPTTAHVVAVLYQL